jgi:hypothetical protein
MQQHIYKTVVYHKKKWTSIKLQKKDRKNGRSEVTQKN